MSRTASRKVRHRRRQPSILNRIKQPTKSSGEFLKLFDGVGPLLLGHGVMLPHEGRSRTCSGTSCNEIGPAKRVSSVNLKRA